MCYRQMPLFKRDNKVPVERIMTCLSAIFPKPFDEDGSSKYATMVMNCLPISIITINEHRKSEKIANETVNWLCSETSNDYIYDPEVTFSEKLENLDKKLKNMQEFSDRNIEY